MKRSAVAGGVLGLLALGAAGLFLVVDGGRDPVHAPQSGDRFAGPEPCDDTGSCAEGFRLDGDFYSISCGAVRPDVVTDHVIARGTYDGAPTELRRIAGVDPHVLVAIRLDGGECGDEDEPISAWSMVFPGDGATRSDREAAICAAAFPQDRDPNRCPPN